MKKNLLLLLLVVNFLYHSYSIEIKKVNPPSEIKGSIYLPLFIGAKWDWEISMNERKSNLQWEIISYNILTDLSNDLKNVWAFEADSPQIGKFYFIEYDGFICSYDNTNDITTIKRILPLNPQEEDKWMIDSTIYTITTKNDERVKIEYENEEQTKFGYQFFRKNIGFAEMFESSKADNGKNIVKFNLKKFTSFDQIPKIDIQEQNKTISLESSIKLSSDSEANLKPKYFLETFENDKIYIQVASFSVLANANQFVEKLVNNGYSAYIFTYSEKLYKVLILVDISTINEKDALQKIKNEVSKGAFIYRR